MADNDDDPTIPWAKGKYTYADVLKRMAVIPVAWPDPKATWPNEPEPPVEPDLGRPR